MEVQPTLEIDSIHLDANFASPSLSPSPSPSPRDKRKKKKKSSSNTNLVSLDLVKQLKLEEEKAKLLIKSSTFPGLGSGSGPCPIPIKFFNKAYEYEDAQASETSPTSPYPLSSSCPSRSALRGGHEGLGLGPRPKLHVKWALDVRDPPETSISHTLRSSSSRKKHQKKNGKKKSKSKRKPVVINRAEVNEPPACEIRDKLSEDPLNSSDASETEDSPVDDENSNSITLSELERATVAGPSETSNWLKFLEVAMQHMLVASGFLAQENVGAALIEYKAAAHVFRLAKLGAETDTNVEEHKSGVEQAMKGQVLAWIAMATLYSASGELSKGQKCHNLAVEACQNVGLSLSDFKNSTGWFPMNHSPGNANHCSLAASIASASCDKGCENNSRTEII